MRGERLKILNRFLILENMDNTQHDFKPYFYTFYKEGSGFSLETHFKLDLGTRFTCWGSRWEVTEVLGDEIFCKLLNQKL